MDLNVISNRIWIFVFLKSLTSCTLLQLINSPRNCLAVISLSQTHATQHTKTTCTAWIIEFPLGLCPFFFLTLLLDWYVLEWHTGTRFPPQTPRIQGWCCRDPVLLIGSRVIPWSKHRKVLSHQHDNRLRAKLCYMDSNITKECRLNYCQCLLPPIEIYI